MNTAILTGKEIDGADRDRGALTICLALFAFVEEMVKVLTARVSARDSFSWAGLTVRTSPGVLGDSDLCM